MAAVANVCKSKFEEALALGHKPLFLDSTTNTQFKGLVGRKCIILTKGEGNVAHILFEDSLLTTSSIKRIMVDEYTVLVRTSNSRYVFDRGVDI